MKNQKRKEGKSEVNEGIKKNSEKIRVEDE